MSIDQVECDGAVVLSRLQQWRNEFSSTKKYLFIIGDREQLETLLANMEYDERVPSAIVAESLAIDVPTWFEQRKAEITRIALSRETSWASGAVRYKKRRA
ncbi:MAG: hypothetical protein ABR568_04090 [Pyrinomonadaceae bacterium]